MGYCIRSVISTGGWGIVSEINIRKLKNLNIIASNSNINQEFQKKIPNF